MKKPPPPPEAGDFHTSDWHTNRPPVLSRLTNPLELQEEPFIAVPEICKYSPVDILPVETIVTPLICPEDVILPEDAMALLTLTTPEKFDVPVTDKVPPTKVDPVDFNVADVVVEVELIELLTETAPEKFDVPDTDKLPPTEVEPVDLNIADVVVAVDVMELLTVTAPEKLEFPDTDNIPPTEVVPVDFNVEDVIAPEAFILLTP